MDSHEHDTERPETAAAGSDSRPASSHPASDLRSPEPPEGSPAPPTTGRRTRRWGEPVRRRNLDAARTPTRRLWLGGGAAAVALVGAAFAVHLGSVSSATPTAVLARPHWSDAASSRTPWSGGGAFSGGGALAGGGGRSGGSAFGSSVTTATDAQQAGVVDIDVALDSGGQAAGTGMILTSTGEVLTNRHVVSGETSMTVTVPATGRTYAAHVVGVAADTDVAVVQMEGASGLDTVKPATHAVSVGDAVVGVGNAGGQGGTPSAAPGQVTDLDQSITATGEDGSDPEQLTGLIETDAAIQPGDSGGPLYDASSTVVGMDTAGSSSGDGYAIPIDTALAAARQIASGGGQPAGTGQSQAQPSASGYLGVEAEDGAAGVQVVGVVDGAPASTAGLAAGDTITSVARRPVQTVSDLGSVMSSLAPGQTVGITWMDPSGQAHAAQVTLGSSAS
ncbi:MAG TPA: trypsin-like peptidase domain-containing protein [Kineosporiaceae bacterium]|nr:trypsin-like peptidase domain-containing protein [Kineosporiaceae bacterium]